MDYNEGMICFSHFAEFGELQKKKKAKCIEKNSEHKVQA